jgi:hypothetical protein
MAEGGILLTIGIGAVGILWLKQKGNSKQVERGATPFFPLHHALLTSLVACLVHNLLDINFYFLSLGSLSFLLLAFWVDSSSDSSGLSSEKIDADPFTGITGVEQNSPALSANCPNSEKRSGGHYNGPLDLSPAVFRQFLAWGMTVVTGLSFLLILRGALTDSLLQLSLAASRSQDHVRAKAYAAAALRWRPYDVDATLLETREAVLAIRRDQGNKREILEILLQGYLRATSLDPYNAHYHFELSRIQSALGENDAASASRARAIQLFPTEPRYRK